MTDSTASDPSTSLEDDHLQRTVDQCRNPKAINMEIISISNLSPTVKHLVLLTTDRPVPISFKAGQWVDMIIPGVDTVGGFSICSSPIHLSKTGELSLCVKDSDHPPAHWVHNRCKPGSKVSIRVGGDFFLDTDDEETAGKNILLVGGGVGINPLASIITQLQDSRKSFGSNNLKSCLMYSAKTRAELLFMNQLNKFALEDETFTAQYFITGEDENVKLKTQEDSAIKYGRITREDIERTLTINLNINIGSEEASKETLVYVCGPPPMINHVQDILVALGINNVHYEKWW